MLVGQRFGPFEIERELGSGAMGTVFMAHWHRDDQRIEPVALKVVSLALIGNESAIARFEREANILQQLRHPHIVRYRASGTHKPSRTKFIAMEFIDGEPLDAILKRRGRISWEDVVHWGKQLCSALQHAHDKGIIHRDLKPSNLMITRDNNLKLTDFGIAKDTDVTALTGANSTIGTAAYMSPEQCKGVRDLTCKSDLYSLGVVFYELLTGKKPFFAETTVDMFLKHVNETPVRPRRLNPEIPIWLDNLVMFLLEKDKDNRPLDAATVGRMLADVEEKVKNQQSVGAELANARKIDRPIASTELDEHDRAAARSLRQTGKKRKKKKGDAWYRKPWVGLGAAGLLLGIILGGLIYVLTPPGMKTAHAAVLAAPPEARLELAAEFLRRFGEQAAPEVDEIRQEYRQAKALQTETILLKRFHSKLRNNAERFDPDAYAAAVLALEAEESGELIRSADAWEAVRQKQADLTEGEYGNDDVATRASLRWVADRHLDMIRTKVPTELQKLRAAIQEQRDFDREPKRYEEGDPASLADLGLRSEDFGDLAKARSAWKELASRAENKPDQCALYLLARQRDFNLASQSGNWNAATDSREQRIREKLQMLQSRAQEVLQQPDDRKGLREVRNGCREIIRLYQSDSSEAIQALVHQAETLKKSLPQ